QDSARLSRARSTRTQAANHFGRSADGHQGLGSPGRGHSLYPGVGPLPAAEESPAALPSAVWPVGALLHAGAVTDGAEAGRATPALGPPPPSTRAPAGGLPCPGQHLAPAGGVGDGPRPPGAGHGSARSRAIPLLCVSLWAEHWRGGPGL